MRAKKKRRVDKVNLQFVDERMHTGTVVVVVVVAPNTSKSCTEIDSVA